MLNKVLHFWFFNVIIIIIKGEKILTNIVLDVANVTKKFGERVAVDNVSFQIFEGEIFGLIGPNGAGKTTIIKMITGLISCTTGTVYICGKNIKKDFEKAIVNVGGIIENPELYTYMSGMDNLKYFASLYPHISQQRINEVVRLVGMEKRIYDKVKTYSLGMKQRVGIAQALLHNPKLLILDEPTNGLDPNGIKEMRVFLKNLASQNKISILISSHILAEMEQLCDTVGIIDGGKLIEVKTIEQLKHGIEKQNKVCIKVDYPNFAGKLIIINYKVPVYLAGNTIIFELNERKIPAVTSMLIKEGISIYGISTITKSLEEVFTEIISKKKSNSSVK